MPNQSVSDAISYLSAQPFTSPDMQHRLSGFRELEARRAKLETVAENSARLATSYATLTTTGWGEIQAGTVVNFDVTFIKQPKVFHGYALNTTPDPSTGKTPPALTALRYPRAFCGVWKWQTDSRGFYKGAWVFFVIDTMSVVSQTTTVAEPNYVIDHSLCFEGVALKADSALSYLLDQGAGG